MRVTMGTCWREDRVIFETAVYRLNLCKRHPEHRGRFQMQAEPDGSAAQAGNRGVRAEGQGQSDAVLLLHCHGLFPAETGKRFAIGIADFRDDPAAPSIGIELDFGGVKRERPRQ